MALKILQAYKNRTCERSKSSHVFVNIKIIQINIYSVGDQTSIPQFDVCTSFFRSFTEYNLQQQHKPYTA